jgi:succinylglutamate desuccinylase
MYQGQEILCNTLGQYYLSFGVHKLRNYNYLRSYIQNLFLQSFEHCGHSEIKAFYFGYKKKKEIIKYHEKYPKRSQQEISNYMYLCDCEKYS